MAPELLYPDTIVDFILEELSYEGSVGLSFGKLWESLGKKVQLDELYKSIIYSWILPNEHVQLFDLKKNLLSKGNYASYDQIDTDNYLVKVSDDFQWIHLTGAPKLNNPVTISAFTLLTEIARNKEDGIDSLSLTKTTGQDSRSLTSRIKNISHLIKKIQILKNGRTLSLFILTKFFDPANLDGIALNTKSDDLTVNLKDLREKIITTLKVAKSGIRQINDLRRELEMDKSVKLKRVFKSAISYLESKGFVAKVLVVSPVSPTKKFRSVRYLKDYVQSTDQETAEDLEDDDYDFNEDLIDDELKELDDDEPSASLKNVVNLQVLEVSKTKVVIPSVNRFYPLQNQVYELVHSHGTVGCSSNFLIEEIFGSSFTRLFAKFIESYTSDKLIPNLANYGIIRHYDFQGRVKFYRYVSRKNFLTLSSQPQDPNGSVLPPFKTSNLKIGDLNKSKFVPLTGNVDIYEDKSHKLHIAWTSNHPNSKFKNSIVDSSKRRGRPTKGQERPKEAKKPKVLPAPKPASEQPEKEVKDLLVISDIQGTSFRSVETQAAILRVLEDSDGIRKDEIELLEDLREELGYNIYRKTYRKDIDSLINQNKVYTDEFVINEETGEFVPLLITATATSAAIISLKNSLLNKKPEKYSLRKLDEISLDIDFFDTELRETFNRAPEPEPIKPAKRSTKERTQVKRAATKKPPKKAPVPVPAPIVVEPPKEEVQDDLFTNLKKRKRSNKKKSEKKPSQPVHKVVSQGEVKKMKGVSRKRTGSQLSSAESLLLFKAVIICKTINENQIHWQKISELLNIGIENLRSKWPRIRMMMGPVGVKIARRTWKRILLAAVKDGKIEIEDIENLDLFLLIELWQDSELLGAIDEDDGEKLYVNIEDNHKEYNFVKVGSSTGMQYDNNSMVQREHYLVNNVSTYAEEKHFEEKEKSAEEVQEELIRNTIIAIVASGNNFDIKKLSVLEEFGEETINKVFLQMTKNRELLISGTNSKILLGDRLVTVLDDNTYQLSIERVARFQNLLKDLLENKKGLVLDPIFDNEFMVPILELIKENGLNLTRVDHYRKEVLSGYEARTLEREKLNSDIILTTKDTSLIKTSSEKQIVVPSGKPCSNIWIDINGQTNKDIWVKVVRVVTTTILSNPGITSAGLFDIVSPLLTKEDLGLLIQWLLDSGAVREGEFEGYWLLPQWYMYLGF